VRDETVWGVGSMRGLPLWLLRWWFLRMCFLMTAGIWSGHEPVPTKGLVLRLQKLERKQVVRYLGVKNCGWQKRPEKKKNGKKGEIGGKMHVSEFFQTTTSSRN
jgi:hypothetical protein